MLTLHGICLAALCLSAAVGCTTRTALGDNIDGAAPKTDAPGDRGAPAADSSGDGVPTDVKIDLMMDLPTDVAVDLSADVAIDLSADVAVDSGKDTAIPPPDTGTDVAPADVAGSSGDAPGTSGDATGDAVTPPTVAACRLCPVGETYCNGQCVKPTDPVLGCGKVCFPCVFKHAEGRCDAAGSCSLGTCHSGYADCNLDPSDGCEADLSNPGTCGSCTTKCTGVCTPSGCADACPAPLTNCAGACLDLATSVKACGRCMACPLTANASGSCGNGTCVPPTCATGLQLCPSTDTTTFSTVCVDIQNDPFNCGACGKTCAGDQQNGYPRCENGQCTKTCLPGWTLCGGTTCSYPKFDLNNCGSCGHACSTTEYCADGACRPQTDQLLLGGLNQPTDIAVNNGTVFYALLGDNSVNSIPVGGGSPTTLASGQAKPIRIAADATHVYWISQLASAVMRLPRSGGGTTPELVAGGGGQPRGLALDSDYVYWSELSSLGGRVLRLKKGTAATGAQTIVDNSVLLGTSALTVEHRLFVVDATVYIHVGQDVYAVPAAGGTMTSRAGLASAFAVDSGHEFTLSFAASASYKWVDRWDPLEAGSGQMAANPLPLVATPCGAQYGGGFIPLLPGSPYAPGRRWIRQLFLPGGLVPGPIVYESGYAYYIDSSASTSSGAVMKVRTPFTPAM